MRCKNKFKKSFPLLVLSIMFVVLTLSFISSVPPVTTTQQFSDGFEIQIPQDNILLKGQDYMFSFHLTNISNGYPIESGVSCKFHLYDKSGAHSLILYNSTTSIEGDYEFFVTGGNFSEATSYYYFVGCNNSFIGGRGESIIIVTNNGYETTTPSSIIPFSLLLMLILFDFFIFYLIFSMNPENKKDEDGNIIGISFIKYFRIFLIGISYALILLTFNLMNASALQLQSIPQFSGIIGGIFDLMLRGAWIWTFLIFLRVLVMLIKDSNISKQIKKMGNPI